LSGNKKATMPGAGKGVAGCQSNPIAVTGFATTQVIRGPVDTCFSIFKLRFATACPSSYARAEMTGHFLR
jgi:hypothetical protein